MLAPVSRLVPLLAIVFTHALAAPLHAAGERTAEQTVDAFHDALREAQPTLALSFLTDDLVVYEMGLVDASREAYANAHLRSDMRAAARREQVLRRRRSGGGADERWVISAYRLQERDRHWTLLETMVLQRARGGWRIAHIHWSSRPK